MIKLNNVTKTYVVGDVINTILNKINLEIQEGELTAIMGPSGAGKTTLMNIIGLLDRPSEGSYYLNNKEVSQLTSDELANIRNRTIGFVFQSFFLLPRLTALQNVGLPLIYRGMKRADIYQRALICLEKVGITSLAAHKPAELSGGEQQRVAIARAFIGQPNLILADEPTGALDSKTGKEILDVLIDLNQHEKTTVVIVTHDLQIGQHCRRIIQVSDGTVIE